MVIWIAWYCLQSKSLVLFRKGKVSGNNDCCDAECVCDTLDEQANVFYNVIAKTLEVGNQLLVAWRGGRRFRVFKL